MTDRRWDDGIRRYDLSVGDYAGGDMYICEDGDYCDVDDVKRVIEARDAEIARLTEALRDATEWRPMSTAPRDGTTIFVDHNGLPAVMWFEFDEWQCYGHRPESEDELRGWLPIPPWKEPTT